MSTIKLEFTILGDPRTKKNSMRIRKSGARRWISPSGAFERYQSDSVWQINSCDKIGISEPVNVCCVYYMATHRRVDLANLIEATTDILVHAGVLADDNAAIVAAHDRSRVRYDKNNPRVEIVIESMEE